MFTYYFFFAALSGTSLNIWLVLPPPVVMEKCETYGATHV